MKILIMTFLMSHEMCYIIYCTLFYLCNEMSSSFSTENFATKMCPRTKIIVKSSNIISAKNTLQEALSF